ncbi:MAG: hypothetical protein MZV65_37965 [Chromatiales bacterium]|nr:hypothetical protein [Chromatiales bacterium]
MAQIRARDRARRPATTTRRSSRSGWPSSPGGVAVIRVGAPSRGRDEVARRTRSTTPSAPPRPRSPRASCRAAGWRCCAAIARGGSARSRSASGDETHRRADPAARARGAGAADRRELGGRRRRGGRTACWTSEGNVGFDAARKRVRRPAARPASSIPTKVVRVALENAVSVASVLLLTEATMTEKPEKKDGERYRRRCEGSAAVHEDIVGAASSPRSMNRGEDAAPTEHRNQKEATPWQRNAKVRKSRRRRRAP